MTTRTPDPAARRSDTLPSYWGNPNPLFYYSTWPLSGLSKRAKLRIASGLLRIHANYLESDKTDWVVAQHKCWWQAYDLIAEEFDEAHLLDFIALRTTIPMMVADASASARWQRGRACSSIARDEFQTRIGSEWYRDSWFAGILMQGLAGRVLAWEAKLLLKPKTRQKRGQERQQAVPHPNTVQITKAIEEILRRGKPSAEDLCKELYRRRGPLPPDVRWKADRWDEAFLHDRSAVRTWISKALAKLRSSNPELPPRPTITRK
jgi:hypothetical protein